MVSTDKDTDDKISPVKFKFILLSIILIQIAAIALGFIYIQSLLRQQEIDLKKMSESSLTVNSASANSNLQAIMNQNTGLETKIANLYVASSSYQNSANEVITNYAKKANLALDSVTTASTGSSSTLAKPLDVKFKNPINYTSFIKFLKYIESSSPKMQVSKLHISKTENSSNDMINVDSLTLEVYVK